MLAPQEKMLTSSQDKRTEIAFFDSHGAVDAYDVFTPASSTDLIDICLRLMNQPSGARIADLGCGSGVFTDLMQRRGHKCVGVDLSAKLIGIGRSKYPGVELIEGDVERLPFPSASLDGVLLSGIVHHLPDPSQCAAEVFRVLRPGGRFVAFDPNRMNPFMWLYRDRSSPFYSSVGVTANERPILAEELAAIFQNAGFETGTDYMHGLHYRYLASATVRHLLPIYHAVDQILFAPTFMKRFRPFVLTYGARP
jgi:ubiquinone/menaquinone biosynthesis C-methylase UbiE